MTHTQPNLFVISLTSPYHTTLWNANPREVSIPPGLRAQYARLVLESNEPGPAKLRSVRFNNARSHRDSVFQFVPGLNVIVGETDSGKTNVVRNILALATNESKDELCTRDRTACSVTAEFRDFRIVSLDKDDDGTNRYTLARAETNEQEVFNSVGNGVPEPVAQALGLGEKSLGGEAVMLNFSSQRGPAFGVDETPSRFARIIGSVSGVDVVLAAVKQAQLERTRLKADGKAARAEFDRTRTAYRSAARSAAVVRGPGEITRAADCLTRAEALRDTRESLRTALTAAGDAVRDARTLGPIGQGAEREAEAAGDVFREAEAVRDLGRVIRVAVDTAEAALRDRHDVTDELERAESDLERAENEWRAYVRDHPNCPVCGGRLAVEVAE